MTGACDNRLSQVGGQVVKCPRGGSPIHGTRRRPGAQSGWL